MADEPTNAELLYGNPGGAKAEIGAIDCALENSGFGHVETSLRAEGDYDLALELGETRKALGLALADLGASMNSVKKIGALFQDHWNAPRDAETAKANYERAIEAMGHRAEELGPAAQETMRFLVAKAPKLAGFIQETGLGNNGELLELLGEIGLHRRKVAKR